MKRIFSFFLVCMVLMTLITSCNNLNLPIVIPSTSQPTIINVPSFDKIEMRAPVHLHLTQDPSHRVEVVADSFWWARLEVEVVGSTLEISFLPDSNRTRPDTLPQYDVDVFVQMPSLTKLSTYTAAKIETDTRFNSTDLEMDLKGAADVTFEADANEMDVQISGAAKLELDVSLNSLQTEINGAGKLIAEGTAGTHDVDILGAGSLETFDLLADTCDITLLGAGRCETTAQTALDVRIVGAGLVYYKGNPTITQSISGLGRVIDAN